MQLNGLTVRSTSRVHLQMCVDIFYIYNCCHNVKINTIVNMFSSKIKEDNDALVCYFVEYKLVVREIVKPSSSFKLQCCKPLTC